MKYVDFLELQKEYQKRKETIKIMRKIKDDFLHGFHGNSNLYSTDKKTYDVVEDCGRLLKRDIERLRKELNEMEV